MHHSTTTRTHFQLQFAGMALKEHVRFLCGTASSIPGLRLLEQACRKCVAVASSFQERPVAYSHPCKWQRSPRTVYTIWQSSLEIAAFADICCEMVSRLLQLTQFRDSWAHKTTFSLSTPSCDCSAAKRPHWKSADKRPCSKWVGSSTVPQLINKNTSYTHKTVFQVNKKNNIE